MKFKLGLYVGVLVIFLTGCNGKSSNTQEGAMPITVENIRLYNQKRSEASQLVSLGDSTMGKVIKTYKIPLEDMGYNFNATILKTTKILKKAPYNQLSIATFNILNDVMQYVKMYPQESIDKGFVDIETRDKILSYLKYSEFNEKTIEALNYVDQCQQSNNGMCSSEQYSKILLDNKFIIPSEALDNLPEYMRKLVASQNQVLTTDQLTGMFHSKVKNASEFAKYIEDKNGDSINVNFLFSEYTKPFKLKGNVQQVIKEYNPWWLKE